MNEAVAYLSKKDPTLAKVIKKVGEPKLRQDAHYFRSLVESIISQQLSVKAADTIFARFLKLFGYFEEVEAKDVADLYAKHAEKPFPTPKQVANMDALKLRSAGLSEKKVLYIHNLAMKLVDKSLDFKKLEKMEDEEVITELVKLHGIGRWTAQMFLMFSFGRADVLATGDLGVRNAVQKLYNLKEVPTEKEVEKIGKKWHPYASLACWYLWRSLSLSS